MTPDGCSASNYVESLIVRKVLAGSFTNTNVRISEKLNLPRRVHYPKLLWFPPKEGNMVKTPLICGQEAQ